MPSPLETAGSASSSAVEVQRRSEAASAQAASKPSSPANPLPLDPYTLGPPAEISGVTEDGVTGVQVVLNGTPRDAVFGNDAWYYRFPNNHTPTTAATKLLVSLSNGRTTTEPLRLGP